MKRAIVVPPALAPAALGELKDWLAITTATDDAALTALLLAALEMCEAFTGQMPLEATCEELLPADTCWRALQTRPVQSLTGVEGIPPEVRASPSRRATMPSISMLTEALTCA